MIVHLWSIWAAVRALPPRFGVEIAIAHHVRVFRGGDASAARAWHSAFRRLDGVDTRTAPIKITVFKLPWGVHHFNH